MKKIKRTTTALFATVFLMFASTSVQLHPSPPFPDIHGKIAFSAGYLGESVDIYVMNADGTDQTQLTHGIYVPGYPTWSPDGKQIAFLHNDRIKLMNADGTNVRQITTVGGTFNSFGMSWSPDGAKIAFTEWTDIFLVNVDGSHRVNLTHGLPYTNYNYEPTWSPDGSRIAFAHGDPPRIFTIKPDKSDARQITDCVGNCRQTSPRWSPTGQEILFSDHQDPNYSQSGISFVSPDGANRGFLPIDSARDPKWSPDGKKIVFWSYPTYQIWVVNRSGSGLIPITDGSMPSVSPDWQPKRRPDDVETFITSTINCDHALCASMNGL